MFSKKYNADVDRVKKALIDYIDTRFDAASKTAKDYLKYGDLDKVEKYKGMLIAYNDISHFITNDLK